MDATSEHTCLSQVPCPSFWPPSHHISFTVLCPIKQGKRGPAHMLCLYPDVSTFLFSFSKTVCCEYTESRKQKKSHPCLFVCCFWLKWYVKSFSNFTIQENHRGHIIARPRSQRFVSGNALDDNAHGSWTVWRELRVRVPRERWNVAGSGVILHFLNHSDLECLSRALSDSEFYISPPPFFFSDVKSCSVFKSWLEKKCKYIEHSHVKEDSLAT